MPVLKHKTPCNQCPFRRKSAPGYLGADNPEHFIQTTLAEVHMPCHCAINYEKKDWQTKQYPKAALCAGALTFLKNTCKLPRDAVLREAMKEIPANHAEVFSFAPQFLEHHNSLKGKR
jgi:hypothetical protein